MAKARVRARTKTNPAFRNLSRKLREAGRGDLRKGIRKAIQEAGAPAVADLRAATLGVNVRVTYITGVHPNRLDAHRAARRSRSTNLRARTAAAIGTQVLASGVRIRVNGKRIDPRYGDNLARYLIGGKRKWGTPVFGDREVFVHFESQDVWFTTLKPHLKAFRSSVQDVIDDTLKKLG